MVFPNLLTLTEEHNSLQNSERNCGDFLGPGLDLAQHFIRKGNELWKGCNRTDVTLYISLNEWKEELGWNLSIVELAINSMPNKSTGYSPSYLNYGYHPRVKSDLIDGSETTQNEFLNGFIKRMDFVWNQSVTQMKNSQELQGIYYNNITEWWF